MKAWDALLASRSQFAVVLEDDARVPPNLADLVQEMIAVLPKHWSTFTIARNILHDL
jgi:GR25 family glycosyltransferase involved in LPS biosynthesis